MPQAFKVQPARFVNAEPGLLPFTGQGPVPAVIVSFEGKDDVIEDKAIGILEARQMVVDILESLATLGDPLAQAIGEQYFSASEGQGDEGDGEYNDGCNDCGG